MASRDSTTEGKQTRAIDFYDLSKKELIDWCISEEEKAFRGKQIYNNLYKGLLDSSGEMTDLSKSLRKKINNSWRDKLELVNLLKGDDGLTQKALFKIKDNVFIETVLMIYKDRATACVSSQAGCPMGCSFCATSKLGLQHNLTTGQIIQQVIWAAKQVPIVANEHKLKVNHLTNIVFMGMGEPFNNYNAWWNAVSRLHDPHGFNMGARNFTVSTVGLVPGILKLSESNLPINLAISLHSPYDEVRSKLMPVNKKYPIKKLLDAVKIYISKTNRRVSFEYLLMQEVSDRIKDAKELIKILTVPEKILSHVNLIPWNPVLGTKLSRSTKKNIHRFKNILEDGGITCTIRSERGIGINAACGQLAGEKKVIDK